jgi:hypothetical protein
VVVGDCIKITLLVYADRLEDCGERPNGDWGPIARGIPSRTCIPEGVEARRTKIGVFGSGLGHGGLRFYDHYRTAIRRLLRAALYIHIVIRRTKEDTRADVGIPEGAAGMAEAADTDTRWAAFVVDKSILER